MTKWFSNILETYYTNDMTHLMSTNLYFLVQQFVRTSSGSCDSNGMEMATNQSQCERAALELDLSDTIADAYEMSGLPHGCIYASDNLLYWINPIGATFTSAACGSTQNGWSFECICVRRGNH